METTIEKIDHVLRARTWDEFVGQARLKELLDMKIDAAVAQERAMDHVLLYGPAGFGKTSLAGIIADRLGDPYTSLRMPVSGKDLFKFFKKFSGGVLLLDELHRCKPAQQEELLPVLEDGYFEWSGRQVAVKFITVVAATTERENLIEPLLDRIHCKPKIDDYTDEEMGLIVQGMARKLDFEIDTETAVALGRAAAGTPRNAGHFVYDWRDMLSVDKTPSVDSVLAMRRVDSDGLTEDHMDYLRCLDSIGGTAGLQTLGNHLRMGDGALLRLERLLVQRQLITYERSGRELSSLGFRKAKHATEPESGPAVIRRLARKAG